jgi:hypothetical protein
VRLSVDSDFPNSSKNKRLALALKLSRFHTAGCCLEVWGACYIARSPFISEVDCDITAEVPGFAIAMVESDLAVPAKAGDVFNVDVEIGKGENKRTIPVPVVAEKDGIRVKGVAARIAFLFKQNELSKLGVAAREAKRSKGQPEERPSGEPQGQPMGSPEGHPWVNPGVNPSSPDLDLPLAPDLQDQERPEEPCPGSADPGQPDLLVLKGKVDTHAKAAKSERADKIPDRAWGAADKLRDLVLADDPKAAIGRRAWGPGVREGARLEWADEFRLMVERDKHTFEEIWDVMKWLFAGSTLARGYVVQSPDSLRKKWDGIQKNRRNETQRAEPGPRYSGRREPATREQILADAETGDILA